MVEKAVVVNPVIDKVLPDERRVNFYHPDDTMANNYMGGYLDEASSYAPGQPTLDTQTGAGGTWSNADRAPGRPSPSNLADTRTANPFKTLDGQDCIQVNEAQ